MALFGNIRPTPEQEEQVRGYMGRWRRSLRELGTSSYRQAGVRTLGSLRHVGTALYQSTGFDYLHGANRYYARLAASRAAGMEGEFAMAGMGVRQGGINLGRRAGAFLRPFAGAFVPGIAIYGGLKSEHGFAAGFVEEVGGFAAWAPGAAAGWHFGGAAGGRLFRGSTAATSRLLGRAPGLGKIPGVGKILSSFAEGTVSAGVGDLGAFLVGGLGWLAGGIIAVEAARWTVGLAVHTLPTFAHQFRHEMSRGGYGGEYKETAGAVTMRQRSLQVMGRSGVNARSALGQEASLLHA